MVTRNVFFSYVTFEVRKQNLTSTKNGNWGVWWIFLQMQRVSLQMNRSLHAQNQARSITHIRNFVAICDEINEGINGSHFMSHINDNLFDIKLKDL